MKRGLYLTTICFLIVVFGILAFFHIWFNTQTRFINVKSQELEREKLILRNELDKLRCEREYLQSPEWLEELAKRFNMTLPDKDPIILLK